MKNQVNLTAHQLETWIAVLSCYEPEIVTRAILEIGLSEDPFPDLGKILSRSELLRRRKSGTESKTETKIIGEKMLHLIADSLQLRIA
jgi:hypothetical protein